jgi:hypothetical protein
MTATTTQMTDTELTALGVKVNRKTIGGETYEETYSFAGVTITLRDHGGYIVRYASLLLGTDGRWCDSTPERVVDLYETPADFITWYDRDAAILGALATL